MYQSSQSAEEAAKGDRCYDIPAEFRIPAETSAETTMKIQAESATFRRNFLKLQERNETSGVPVARTRSGGIGINILALERKRERGGS